jgi:hypothetical protein
MTSDGRTDMPGLIARLLMEPALLHALEHHDMALLRRELTDDVVSLATLAALDLPAVRHYRRVLQRKRLEIIEPIFIASLPAARAQYGVDPLAIAFWHWYQQAAGVPVHDVHADVAAAWTRFAAHLARRGPLGWLGDLSRYEFMRWSAVFHAAAPDARGLEETRPGPAYPVLSPGTSVSVFQVDVPSLLRTAIDGNPVPTPAVTRLITWSNPGGGVNTARLGRAAHDTLRACDGSRTIDQVAATVGGGRDGTAHSRMVALLHDLARAGAVRLLVREQVPAEHHHSGLVQATDRVEESG